MRRTIAVTAVTSVVVAVFSALPAKAADPVDSTANLIAEVAPSQGVVVDPRKSGDHFRASAEAVTVAVPTNPSAAVAITPVNDSTSGVTVALPAEAEVKDGHVADDGTVVYPADASDSPTVAIQVLGDGAIRLQTIIPSVGAAHEFTYAFGPGIHPVVTNDGGALLFEATPDGGAQVVAQVAPAWAVDASGAAVGTRYEVSGDHLIQHVDAPDSAAYPVVADPSVSYGLTWRGPREYVKYSKSETKTIARFPGIDKAKYLAIVCAVIPIGWVAAACGLATYDEISGQVATFKSAAKDGKCVKLTYIPIANILTGWNKVTC
jgi:hypothetical protein